MPCEGYAGTGGSRENNAQLVAGSFTTDDQITIDKVNSVLGQILIVGIAEGVAPLNDPTVLAIGETTLLGEVTLAGA